MEVFLNAVANFGFPIVVCTFLLVRQEKNTKEQTTQIVKQSGHIKEQNQNLKNLGHAIEKLTDKLDK